MINKDGEIEFFCDRLKRLRKEMGLSQAQVAERLHLAKATISYYEQSVRTPSPDVLISFTRLFKVSADYLLGIEKDKKTVDVSDLTDEEITVIENMIKILRKNHLKKGKEG